MTAPHQNLLGTSGAVDTEETDPNFNQTVLLLHGDGTNGGQNNSFLDSSSSGHTITRYGNATQGTFNPFLGDGQYSNFFDGNADYLRIASSSDFVMGTGNFTIEFFAYFLDAGAGGFVTVESTGGMAFYYTGSYFTLSARGGGQAEYVKYTHTPALNTWHHIAVCRSGTGSNETALFFNGSRVAQSTNDLDYTVQAVLDIGDINAVTGYDFNGYLSNLRIVKGSSVYDTSSSSITVPSTALTAIDSNTKLLTCQSNRFVDNSTSGHTISINGAPKVVPFSPFAPTASYSESVHGGSAYFDGSGDYLNIPTSNDLDFGTGDFTLEFWLYPNEALGWHLFLSAPQNTTIQIGYDTGNGPRYLYFYNGANIITGTGVTSLIAFSFNHVALVRQGTTISLFSNGNRVGTATYSSNVSFSNLDIARYHGGGYDMNSHMSSIRAVKGSAVYNPSSTTYTIPTTPLASTGSETKLLLNFTNASIIDSTMKNNLETVDNAQIDTSIKKFGTGSIQFDGSGDYLTGTNQPYITIGYSSYTFECFVYITTGVQTYHGLLSIVGGIQFQLSNELMRLSSASAQILIADGGDEVALNTWTHLAFVKDSSTDSLKFFKDGTLIKSGTDATNWNHTGALQVGRIFNSSTYDIEGYIDEARLTLAPRYSSSFTAPTKSHPNK